MAVEIKICDMWLNMERTIDLTGV
ncbi:hypothetical protein A2U01_0091035, partial [Trifolium medium]|nr:hypothetical protein [Trifolium medium]